MENFSLRKVCLAKTHNSTQIQMKNFKILIPGGAGFVGSNLALNLGQNNELVILDNLSNPVEDLTPIEKNLTMAMPKILIQYVVD